MEEKDEGGKSNSDEIKQEQAFELNEARGQRPSTLTDELFLALQDKKHGANTVKEQALLMVLFNDSVLLDF